MSSKKRCVKILGLVVALVILAVSINFVSAREIVSVGEATICCQETVSGLFCQDVPEAQCKEGATQAPTACESTSFCRPGYCFDSKEGTCQEKTSQLVCNANGGVWRAEKPAQCELGCCVLGDQAAFVTQTRCKKLSSFLGLKVNFRNDLATEFSCIASLAGQDRGACVYEKDLITSCTFTTRDECTGGVVIEEEESGGFLGFLGTTNSETVTGDFYPGKLCSAEELGTNCAPTTETACIPGRDGVYFVDSCGNPANVYDADKVDNAEYWSNYRDISEACNPDDSNADSRDCGNCNYLLGSTCRETERGDTQPEYGGAICKDLNCYDTHNGNDYRHGESWCVYDDKGDEGIAVGARFYKHICINGEEILEPCADYKQEICIEDFIGTPEGAFAQAACRVNRWQDCTGVGSEGSCEDESKRDCRWINTAGAIGTGTCVPRYSPGTQFWNSEEADDICEQVDTTCTIKYTEDLSGDIEYTENEFCRNLFWLKAQREACRAVGDCEAKSNWEGTGGRGSGHDYFVG